MTDNHDRQGVLRAIRATLAAHYACTEADLTEEGVTFTRAEVRPGRLRFPVSRHPLGILTLGAGVIVSCDDERRAILEAKLANLERDQIFSAPTIGWLVRHAVRDGQELRGPDPRYTCARSDLRPAAAPEGIELTTLQRDQIPGLYVHHEFRHALVYRTDSQTPEMLAVVAKQGERIVGVAAASAENDDLWQIGVDVVEGARGAGIGRAMVSRLTAGILDAGRVPFYTAAVSNIRSRALAVGLGFWPVWLDMYVKDNA